jgi:hypothetical protein
MAAVGGSLPIPALAVAVLVTLVVYWLAEQYAELLAEQASSGSVPDWASVRSALGTSWPIVSASFAPLVALVLAGLAGASGTTAANAGVGVAVVVLTVHGFDAARAAQLRGWRLWTATSMATVLGLMMVVLKNLVLLHLH